MKQFQEFALIASVLIPAITKIWGDIQRKVKHLKSTRQNIQDPGGTFFHEIPFNRDSDITSALFAKDLKEASYKIFLPQTENKKNKQNFRLQRGKKKNILYFDGHCHPLNMQSTAAVQCPPLFASWFLSVPDILKQNKISHDLNYVSYLSQNHSETFSCQNLLCQLKQNYSLIRSNYSIMAFALNSFPKNDFVEKF